MEQNEKLRELMATISKALSEMENLVNKNELDSISVQTEGYTITFKFPGTVAEKLRKKEPTKIDPKKSFINTIDKIKSSKITQAIKNVVTFPFRYVNGKWTSMKRKAHDKVEQVNNIIDAFKAGVATFKTKAGFKKRVKNINPPLNQKSFIYRATDKIITKIEDIIRPVSTEQHLENKAKLEEIKKQKEERINEVNSSVGDVPYNEPEIVENIMNFDEEPIIENTVPFETNNYQQDPFVVNPPEAQIINIPPQEPIKEVKVEEQPVIINQNQPKEMLQENMTNAQWHQLEAERLKQEKERLMEEKERREFEERKAKENPIHDGSVIELPESTSSLRM